jgi:hypothetical protein
LAIGVANLGSGHDVLALADTEVLLEGAWATIAFGFAVVLLTALTSDVTLFVSGARAVDNALTVRETVGKGS